MAAFFNEKLTKQKVVSAFLIFIGAIAVLYNGQFHLNRGDLLILAGTFLYPFGNVFAKKAFKLVSSSTIIFLRSFMGGAFLLGLAFIFEKEQISFSFSQNEILLILANGLLIMALTKILFYEGLKRLEISKTITIGMSYPALSLVFAIIFLNEKPSIYQIIGLAIIMGGLFVSTRKKTPVEIQQN